MDRLRRKQISIRRRLAQYEYPSYRAWERLAGRPQFHICSIGCRHKEWFQAARIPVFQKEIVIIYTPNQWRDAYKYDERAKEQVDYIFPPRAEDEIEREEE